MDSAGGKGARLADPLAKASATGAPLLGGLRQDGAPGAGQGREQRIRSRLTTADHDGQGKKLAVRLATARTCRIAGVAQTHTHAQLSMSTERLMATMIAELVCVISLKASRTPNTSAELRH